MRQLGILLLSSIVAAACASNKPPEPSSATVARATNVPNNGPDFSPASADGLATAHAEKRSPAAPTQPAPNLNPPPETALNTPPTKAPTNDDTANNTWGNGVEGSGSANPSPGNATASPRVRSSDADNTAVNQRDRSSTALTPMDQGPSPADRSITAQIRQAVMRDSTLSFTAKNVKIVTINGRVTLRGTVKTDAERAAIESAARKIAGSAQVESQLEIGK
jgi:hypothetical protein